MSQRWGYHATLSFRVDGTVTTDIENATNAGLEALRLAARDAHRLIDAGYAEVTAGEVVLDEAIPDAPEPDPEQCRRCGSDTCPGRDDVLNCTALIDGKSAPDEARLWMENR